MGPSSIGFIATISTTELGCVWMDTGGDLALGNWSSSVGERSKSSCSWMLGELDWLDGVGGEWLGTDADWSDIEYDWLDSTGDWSCDGGEDWLQTGDGGLDGVGVTVRIVTK